MKSALLTAILIVLVFLVAVCIAKCPCGCGCWRWCSCVMASNAMCCCSVEPMANINLNRVVSMHYVDWCPHCKTMKPIWEQVKKATSGSGIIFKDIDEDKAKTEGINGYPTIRMITEKGTVTEYTGGPDFERLRNWVVSPRPHHS